MTDPCSSCEQPSRRRVLKGVGAATLIGIAAPALASCSNADVSSELSSGEEIRVAQVHEVPEGQGKSFPAGNTTVLIAQPLAGEFVAFSSVCTHQGCQVGEAEKNFLCPCHDSGFSFEDGRAMFGPAREPLPSLELRLDGDDIYVTV